ncbi:ATP-binding protein [Actinoplanes oblitus]|uniref:Sensor-like histidine kinase SenX3 n=1 Tax=Actinoplanes oblitus TaxID=3040509 RepID=A0ABY8W4U6_9ACTN|nr:ATP-binding protein [Actinoplanes oblitus]WIM92527.1 ATP-binding protein [Actinoplanes oblitus]
MSSMAVGRGGSELDYRSLFQGAPAALLVLDTDLVIREVTDAYLAITMRERDELLGQHIFTAFPSNPGEPGEQGVARLAASLERVCREGVTDVMGIHKYDIRRPGGGFETRYWAPVTSPVFTPGGEIALLVHRVEDVTEYMLAQQDGALGRLAGELRARTEQMESALFARRQAQERTATMQAAVDSLDIAIFACDAHGRPVLRNQIAHDLLGDHWPEQLRPPLRRAVRGEVVDTEAELRLPGLPRRILRINARPIAGQPGLSTVVALRDITARRLALRLQEGELEVTHLIAQGQPSGETLQQVMRIVGTSIGWSATEFWVLDEVTRSLRREARWVWPHREPGRAGPACLGSTDRGPGDPRQALPGRAWRAAEPVWEPTSPDGGTLAIPVPAGPKPLGVLVCYSDTDDIPEVLRDGVVTGIGARLGEFLERRRAERLSAELERTRDEYIALVGHELRTPLTSIQAHTELLLDEPGLDEDQRDALEVMRRNTVSLRDIVMRLLDVAGLRWGHIALNRAPMDLAGLVREVAAARPDPAATSLSRTGAALSRTDASGARTGVVVAEAGPVIVDGDRDRLREVLDELLANAVTWAAGGSTVEVTVRADAGAAVVTVSNLGKGIPPDERGRLFDLFFRGEAARHQGVPGHGLGLTVARAIVEQHGGTLTVSGPGEPATTFTIRLPERRDTA